VQRRSGVAKAGGAQAQWVGPDGLQACSKEEYVCVRVRACVFM